MKLIHTDIRKTKSYHIAPIFFKSKILSHYIQIHLCKLHLEKKKQNKTKAWVQEGLYKKIIGMVKIYKFENFL